MRGFSLVELVVALAVAAVLVGVAAPSFRDTVADVRLTGTQNRLVKALRQARAEAIKRARPATLCSSDDGTSCGGSWSDGWLVYADTDATGSVGTLDDDDALITAHASATDGVSIQATATVRPDAAASKATVRFGPRGRPDWTSGTIVLCDGRGAGDARAIIVNGAGGLRSAAPDGATVTDAAGDEVTCP